MKENIEHQIETKETNEPKEKTIKHIILSGGGIAGFSYYGALKETAKQGLWDINNIKTSIGIDKFLSESHSFFNFFLNFNNGKLESSQF